ncbi:MAG: hypothetical protein ABIE55_01095 [Candidatus Aenigmatarchaeota archaeon]
MKKKFDEDKVLAILYSNFSSKGKQINDWIFIAKKLNELKDFYKSEKKVAKNLRLSYEMVRSTIKLLDLPKIVQQMIKKGEISQDLGWRLLGIKNKKDQIKVAKAIVELSAHDARDMIRYAKNNPSHSIEKHIKRLKKSKKKTREINVVVLTLDEATYKSVKEISKENKTEPNKMISKIVENWIKRRYKK